MQFWSWIQNFFCKRINEKCRYWNWWFVDLFLQGWRLWNICMCPICKLRHIQKSKNAAQFAKWEYEKCRLELMICKSLSSEVKVLKYLHEPHNQTSYGLLHKIAYIAGPDQPAFKNKIYCSYCSCRQTSTSSWSALSFVSSCSQSTPYLLTL